MKLGKNLTDDLGLPKFTPKLFFAEQKEFALILYKIAVNSNSDFLKVYNR